MYVHIYIHVHAHLRKLCVALSSPEDKMSFAQRCLLCNPHARHLLMYVTHGIRTYEAFERTRHSNVRDIRTYEPERCLSRNPHASKCVMSQFVRVSFNVPCHIDDRVMSHVWMPHVARDRIFECLVRLNASYVRMSRTFECLVRSNVSYVRMPCTFECLVCGCLKAVCHHASYVRMPCVTIHQYAPRKLGCLMVTERPRKKRKKTFELHAKCSLMRKYVYGWLRLAGTLQL